MRRRHSVPSAPSGSALSGPSDRGSVGNPPTGAWEASGPTRPARSPRLELSGVVKEFGPKRAVDRVDLVIEPGTFLVLLGPSGSGKTTLLRCLAGIETPTGGTIAFDGQLVDGPGVHLPPERRDLAMVFQDYALWPHLTAEANVAFALQRRRIGPDERRRLARAMLAQVGLADLGDRYPGQLSGGEQQRVALARALVARPGLLLFDEPLSNLDADRREHLRVDISSMVREHGATAVYITHDQAEAFALADVVGVLEHGRLVQAGPPEVIYREPASAFVARFTGLAGELVGTVTAIEPPFVRVDVGGQSVSGRPIGDPVTRLGQAVRVLVRPAATSLAIGPADGSSRSVVSGQVRDAAFRGWGYEHVVDVGGGRRLTGVAGVRRLPIGQRVDVALERDGCLIAVETDEPATDPTASGRSRAEQSGAPALRVPTEDPGLDEGARAAAAVGPDAARVSGRW
jgi:iron(III) transport system ATP-binding protein